jgi:hypothetical protein
MFHVKQFGKIGGKIFAMPFTSSGLGRVGLGKIVVSLAADGLGKTSSPFIRAYCPVMKFGAQGTQQNLVSLLQKSHTS